MPGYAWYKCLLQRSAYLSVSSCLLHLICTVNMHTDCIYSVYIFLTLTVLRASIGWIWSIAFVCQFQIRLSSFLSRAVSMGAILQVISSKFLDVWRWSRGFHRVQWGEQIYYFHIFVLYLIVVRITQRRKFCFSFCFHW